ncbi:alpha/beta hydrolase family protein [Pseudoduganella chitinolytica]|uniref:Prolyl oligopeptidase family serine peptidase n=1 Tax=Pseudoduganella chitinolytica TaxID=34070 RepID=A0ABY8B699_9BURK|nr:alpha/beta fold hydrolase [Pseudoduganella chitinolytica]WEF31454.1 prolyl oligopeptidase family serine peptidase [Pseudoduganella chitinolytica]
MRAIPLFCASVLCALFATAAAAQTAPAAAPPPAAAFFANPAFTGGVLSPSGRYLAAKVDGKTGRDALAVIDLTDKAARVVAGFADADIGTVQWVNDERLLFDTTDKQIAAGAMRFAPGLYTVKHDGSKFRQLAERREYFIRDGSRKDMLPWHTYMMDETGKQDSDYVYVRDIGFAGNTVRSVDLLRLNVATGTTSSVNVPFTAIDWMLDNDGEPRLAHSLDKGKATIWLRDRATDKWRVLASFEAYGPDEHSFEPIGFGPDGTLYARARRDNDQAAIFKIDLQTGTIGTQPVLRVDGFDFSGHLVADATRLLGVRYQGDARDTAWFDPAFKAIQADVDAKLPGTANLIGVPRRPDTPHLLVTAYSDVQPNVYFIYDTATRKLDFVGQAHKDIRAKAMGHQHFVTYAARDGLKIPAMLTLPPGVAANQPGTAPLPKNLPLVVLVHGGPYVRGTYWQWDPEVQFLASRGYAVLQPEFRGSTGYGREHFARGLKQWGLAMQDDIADGARWAIAQGYADPARICIAGASYGGYATLMGLVRNPTLYRCGVAWAGVTDINLMYTGHWRYASDVPEEFKEYGMPQLIGDPVKDAEQLKATSPLQQASRIRQPLLLAYGTADERVPMIHGTRFRDAVKAVNKEVEWIEYEDEGHGWSLPQNRIDFWTRVERFLDRHIGTGRKTATP